MVICIKLTIYFQKGQIGSYGNDYDDGGAFEKGLSQKMDHGGQKIILITTRTNGIRSKTARTKIRKKGKVSGGKRSGKKEKFRKEDVVFWENLKKSEQIWKTLGNFDIIWKSQNRPGKFWENLQNLGKIGKI